MSNLNKLITVFTPTYNRAYILPQSYEALCNQTNKDFIWMVVDDGSTDNTKELIEIWKEEKKIEIEYVYQENAGKQRAINTGVKKCNTTLFAFLDSDDYYKPDTIERFIDAYEKIKDNTKVAGVLGRRGTTGGEIVGNPTLPQDRFIGNVDEIIRKYNFTGDTCRVYKTEILRKHLYPEIQDKFILESVMLSSIDREYDLYIINEIFSVSSYLKDGYTKNSYMLYHNNPFGYALGLNQLTISKRGFLRTIKYTAMYTNWCWINRIEKPSRHCKNKSKYYIALPLSLLFYVFKIPKWYYMKE